MNAISGFERFDTGMVMENVVFIHLLINGYSVTTGKTKGKEIDFIAGKNWHKLYIQAVYLLSDKQVINRESGNLHSIKGDNSKTVISLDEFAPENINGIRHVHLRKFLSGNDI